MFEPRTPPSPPERPVERSTYAPVDGEYLAPAAGDLRPRHDDGWKSKAGGAAVGLGLLAAKAKGLVFLVLSFKGYLLSALSILVSIWFYTLFFGVKFAVAFVALIFVHEMGHVLFIRSAGLTAGKPYFIPGFGAFVTTSQPASAYDSAWIAFAGPLCGGLAAGACLALGMVDGDPFWKAVAYTGFFMNFLNLMPVPPFDGGRMVGAISPRVWVGGLVLFIVGVVVFHVFASPLIVLVVIFAIPQVVAAFRNRLDPTFYTLTTAQRVQVALGYFALALALFVGMEFSQVHVPGGPAPTTLS